MDLRGSAEAYIMYVLLGTGTCDVLKLQVGGFQREGVGEKLSEKTEKDSLSTNLREANSLEFFYREKTLEVGILRECSVENLKKQGVSGDSTPWSYTARGEKLPIKEKFRLKVRANFSRNFRVTLRKFHSNVC